VTPRLVSPERVVATPLDVRPDRRRQRDEVGLRSPAIVTVRGWQLLLADPVAQLHTLGALSRYADAVGWRDERPDDGPPFRTGAVGFISDDVSGRLLELGPDRRPAVSPLPPLRFGVHDWAVAISPEGRGWVVADRERTPALRSWAAAAAPAGTPPPVGRRRAHFGLPRRDHAAAVHRILEWVAAGDLYQANLTFQTSVPWSADPRELAVRLQAATPGAAHAALLVDDRSAVVSVSPETFLRTDGDRITTRPIKGTRPRSAGVTDDQDAAVALLGSAKDHAEHVMIVDLTRNDLGRVCRTGTVVVGEYAALEGHPTVWHLTSTVEGQLLPDATFADVVAATFPPGSVTGTPKRMSVARTRLLEPVRRGVYCGAIGVVTTGMVDLSVAIRTAVVTGGVASYGTGGGIVADSDATAEYDEAMDKAAAFLRATGATGS
jgi:para-aminobenzoate synthetase component 1